MTPRQRRSRWARPQKASVIPGAMNMEETTLQSHVGRYATARGALHYHTHNSERSAAGFPDSVIVGNWVMWRELKSDSDSATVSAKQREWIERLEGLGEDAGIWWPIDWETNRIQNEISACTKKRKPNGGLIMPDLAKTLFLMSDARPAAGIHWDAGSRGIDRILWQEHARSLAKMIAHALPTGTEEVLAWLERHELPGDVGAAAIIEALRQDIARADGEKFLG